MIENVSKKLVDYLICNKVIGQDDFEVYMYGMVQLLRYIVNTLPMIIISIFLGEYWRGILFIIAFDALRTYAGGCHSRTPKSCFIFSICLFTSALLLMKYIEVSDFICWSGLLFSSVIILCLSPVEAINKPLDCIEKKLYRKKSIIIWCVETIAIIVLMLFNRDEITICIILVQVVVGLSLVVGWFEKRRYQQNSERMVENVTD